MANSWCHLLTVSLMINQGYEVRMDTALYLLPLNKKKNIYICITVSNQTINGTSMEKVPTHYH